MSDARKRRKLQVLPEMPPGMRRQGRLVSRGPEKGPIRLGFHNSWYSDPYHRSLVMPWPWFLLIGSALYLSLNVLFALLYWWPDGTIDHARPGSFTDAFFFSIQTMATIGYGVLTPTGTYANVVVTVETMVALIFVAFTTGLTFSRFSRPTARVTFSKIATVSPHNGVPTLSVRLSNARRNQILEADVSIVLLRLEHTRENRTMRRFYDLSLSRGHTPVFALTFTVMHPIDEASPLFGMTPEMLQAEDAELLVTVTGLDETMSQTVHARTSYTWDEILLRPALPRHVRLHPGRAPRDRPRHDGRGGAGPVGRCHPVRIVWLIRRERHRLAGLHHAHMILQRLANLLGMAGEHVVGTRIHPVIHGHALLGVQLVHQLAHRRAPAPARRHRHGSAGRRRGRGPGTRNRSGWPAAPR